MDSVLLGLFINVAMGFAIGGVLMSGHFLVTGKPLGFAFNHGNAKLIPLEIALRLVAGPAILMHNVLTMEDDSLGLTLAGVLIAGAWSLGSGALLLQSIGSI
jgi:hypothetical protein